jgi:hypothetical protein
MRSRILINYNRSFRDDSKSADAMIQLDPNSSEICIPRRVCKELQCSWVTYVGTTATFKTLQNMMEYCRTIKYDEKTDNTISCLGERNYSCISSDNDRGRQKSYSISVTRPALHINDNSDSEDEDEDDADQTSGVCINIGVLQDH